MTDKEMFSIINDMVIVTDTREQQNKHIFEFLDNEHIPYIIQKLDSADYSCVFPNYPQYDFLFLVERKGSLDELAGNFTKGRERFVSEFERIKENQKVHLLLEEFTWTKLFHESYRSKFNCKSYSASIFTWNIRYNCPVWTCTKKESGIIIYNIFKYELLELLKK